MKHALVLSGGGMFGAWQAGVWKGLSARLERPPDLVAGASVGALNGYAIAGGATGDELCSFWMQQGIGRLRELPRVVKALMERFHLRTEYALTLTELTRLKPYIVRGEDVTWRHLAASCAIPGLLPQRRIGGRWYTDGGLLNPLPVWAAVELGATEIIGIHAIPQIPSLVKPFVKGFRIVFGYHPPLPEVVKLVTIAHAHPLGNARDALVWKRANIERWIEQGERDAKNISLPNCFWR